MSQYESADLVLEFTSGRRALRHDPRWAASGAGSPVEYAAWASRVCGLACLRTVLGHWGRRVPPVFELIASCEPFAVYDADGAGSPGLRYRPFVDYLAAVHGIAATVVEDDIGAVIDDGVLAAGGFWIWSVHPGIRTPDEPPPSTGGHLVVVHGFDREAGTVAFCNPSGHHAAARGARLPLDVFAGFAARRGMALAGPGPRPGAG